jgi:hypothetical protein
MLYMIVAAIRLQPAQTYIGTKDDLFAAILRTWPNKPQVKTIGYLTEVRVNDKFVASFIHEPIETRKVPSKF